MNECFISFDVEDWFQAHNLEQAISRDTWDSRKLRVRENTKKILDLLDKHDVKATFFILGWIAQRCPELIKLIDRNGHEIASHGYDHSLLDSMGEEKIRDDLKKSKEILQSLVEQRVKGYRAPSFTIDDRVLDMLKKIGYEYDSSYYKIVKHDRYGDISQSSEDTFYRLKNGLIEAQMPTLNLFNYKIPWAGGGYFRFIPYPIYRLGIEKILNKMDFIFYLHPWEMDPDQPNDWDVKTFYRLRHYTNLKRTEDRLDKLLSDFDWKPIGERI